MQKWCVLLAMLVLGTLSEAQVSTNTTTITEGDTTALMLKRLQAIDGAVLGGISGTITKNSGILWSLTQAFGVGGAGRNKPLTLDSCFGMNTMGEILVAYAAVKLFQDVAFTSSLDNQISTTFSPSGLLLQNPTNQKPITYKMLLTHTSTITDVGFAAATLSTPNTVGTLASFIDNYFVTSGGQLVSSIFMTNKEPGTASAFKFARINVALMAYILERVIVNNNLGYASLKHYIAQEILGPFGMSSTFFLNPDGSAPGVLPTPDFSVTFSTAAIGSASAYTSYFQGCIVDQMSTGSVLIHPAYPADFMAYTTLSDLLALISALFINTKFSGVSLVMREMLTVDASIAQQAQKGQGLGLTFYDGIAVCASGTTTNTISSCPLTNQTVIIGYSSARGTTTVGFYCSETVTYGQFCTASAFIYSSSATRSYDTTMAMAAAAIQEKLGTVTLSTPAPPPMIRTDGEEKWFGVYVFIAVFGSILIVVFGTSLLQYLFQPATRALNANTAVSTYALGPDTDLSAPPKERRQSGALDDR
jgi:CubicO group peptidase (beta-lactamase class C family)